MRPAFCRASASAVSRSASRLAKISDKQAQARAVQSQVDTLNTKVEIAAEDYNKAADHYAKLTRKVRKTSFTLAPEAGTRRLRDIINKGNTEADLLDTLRKVFETGWQLVKLYFMIGLPAETPEDIRAIIDLTKKIRHHLLKTTEGKKQVEKITLSLNSFVPKPATPFQWHPLEAVRQLTEKIKSIRKLRERAPQMPLDVLALGRVAHPGAVAGVHRGRSTLAGLLGPDGLLAAMLHGCRSSLGERTSARKAGHPGRRGLL